ncbi:MAG: CBS domain-containing protein [Thermodesulfobacteriota bacterium]
MPHSVPVKKLMIPVKEWPQLRVDLNVGTAIKILRIISEERKLEHGHSTPLVFDEQYNLVGFVHLVDLLKAIRHTCDRPNEPCDLTRVTATIKDLVVPFAESVKEDDTILKALDVMMDHRVSLVPVMRNGKVLGIVKLADIFNTVAGLLFDEQDPDERKRLLRDYQ